MRDLMLVCQQFLPVLPQMFWPVQQAGEKQKVVSERKRQDCPNSQMACLDNAWVWVFCFCFETGSLCVALAAPELTM